MLARRLIICSGFFTPSGIGIGITPSYNPSTSKSWSPPNFSAITSEKALLTDLATGFANLIHESIVPLTQSSLERTSGVPDAGFRLQFASSHKFASLSALLVASATCAFTVPPSPVAFWRASN